MQQDPIQPLTLSPPIEESFKNSAEPEIITPEAADAILDQEIAGLEKEGWKVKKRVVYGVRLSRERHLLDVRVDLLGNVEKEESITLVYGPDVGFVVAWMVLLAWLIVALTFVSVVGLD
jgi:hypothetical protein